MELGDDCELVSHVVLDGHTRLGNGNRIFPFTAVGVPPQDLKYKGEPTRLEIGNRNVIREYVTISRGTQGGGGITRLGDDCLIMAYAHIGHDSHVGNQCILANGATLAGHVTIEDYATLGALPRRISFAASDATRLSAEARLLSRTCCRFAHLRKTRCPCLRIEQGGSATPGIFIRPDAQPASRLPDVTGCKVEHHAGAGEIEGGRDLHGRGPLFDSVH